MRNFVTLMVVALLVSGCANLGASRERDAAAGHAFVRRACAGCHAIEAEAASPNPNAPPFRYLAAGLPGARLSAELGGIAARGHGEMPPIYMTPAEIGAVAAYIRAVAPPPRLRGNT